MDNKNFQEYQNNDLQKTNTDLEDNKRQKIALGILAVFSFVIIILWMSQLKNSVKSPLNNNTSTINTESAVCQGSNCENTDERAVDTDKDGLSDWDEQNIYNTSPYLTDSDSDGYSDGEEVALGGDPNCPKGQDCYNTEVYEDDNNLEEEIEEDLNKQQEFEAIPSVSSLSEDELVDALTEEILAGNGDADALREILVATGMDEELLNQISDEDLLDSYRAVLENNSQ